MEAHILNIIPESGAFYEVRFDAVSECTWVKFQNSDHCDWVGVFGDGWGGGHDVSTNENGICFIISGGQGYIININTKQLLHKTECDYLHGSIAMNCDTFVASDGIRLRVYNVSGEVYCSKRISFDGVQLTKTDGAIVNGKVWDLNCWVDFSFNPDTYNFKCAWSCPID
ncbi:MAG: hypothetical protein OIF34_03370 [Porticoccaceae bacterium]|nr:hypothetical protein [Porticoccaceae bacterium]